MVFNVISVIAFVLSIWACCGVWFNTKTLGTILNIFKEKDEIDKH